jgi:acyl carrier protein
VTIEPTMTFNDLDLDSLSLAELGAQLEDDLGVTVEEENLTAETTVADIAALLEAQGAVVPA